MSKNPTTAASSSTPQPSASAPGAPASATPATSGLEVLGIPGGSYLREALTSCSDPLLAIEEFQIENGILLPSLRPMMPLLDLHGVKRLDFHISVMEVSETRCNVFQMYLTLYVQGTTGKTLGSDCRAGPKRRKGKG